MEPLTIAVSKGRILDDALPLLAEAGIVPTDNPEKSRKLILETETGDTRLVIIRAQDVPTFIEYGAADVGITGKDVLLEHDGEGLYDLLDLGIAECRLMVAGRPGSTPPRTVRVATKYVRTARAYYAAQGVQVEIIKLYGSMELAPLVGLADRIVDLVDTGNTLRANGLEPLEHIVDISSRLIANRAAMKLKHERIRGVVERLSDVLQARKESVGA